MIKKIIISGTLAGMCLLGTVAPVLAQQGGIQMRMSPAAIQLNATDQKFMTAVNQGNIEEIQLGHLALTNSSNPQIQMMGRRFIQDHSNANADLVRIAQGLNVTLPQTTNTEQKTNFMNLSGKTGPAFDQMFLTTQYTDHTQTIGAFQRELHFGANSQLKQYANQYLATITQHRNMLANALNSSTQMGMTPGETPVSVQRAGQAGMQQQNAVGTATQPQSPSQPLPGERNTSYPASNGSPGNAGIRGYW